MNFFFGHFPLHEFFFGFFPTPPITFLMVRPLKELCVAPIAEKNNFICFKMGGLRCRLGSQEKRLFEYVIEEIDNQTGSFSRKIP